MPTLGRYGRRRPPRGRSSAARSRVPPRAHAIALVGDPRRNHPRARAGLGSPFNSAYHAAMLAVRSWNPSRSPSAAGSAPPGAVSAEPGRGTAPGCGGFCPVASGVVVAFCHEDLRSGLHRRRSMRPSVGRSIVMSPKHIVRRHLARQIVTAPSEWLTSNTPLFTLWDQLPDSLGPAFVPRTPGSSHHIRRSRSSAGSSSRGSCRTLSGPNSNSWSTRFRVSSRHASCAGRNLASASDSIPALHRRSCSALSFRGSRAMYPPHRVTVITERPSCSRRHHP